MLIESERMDCVEKVDLVNAEFCILHAAVIVMVFYFFTCLRSFLD